MIKSFKELLVTYRRELHRHPELSLQEFETTRRLKTWLKENDIFYYDLSFEPGVVAEIKGELDGPTIALRADIDALPIQEASGLEYSSQNTGVAHCCGHDTHMTIMLGAAILLRKRIKWLKGTVRLIFQPGEESSQGAAWFLEQYPDLLKDVKAIFGVHNKPELPIGTIGLRSGPLMASVDKFIIEIEGKGGHGGMPELCIDPITAGSQLVNSLQNIVSRRLSAFDNVVVSVTQFHAGNTWNVIPKTAYLEGTVRTFQQTAREKVPTFMEEICKGIGEATSTRISFKWLPSLGVVNNYEIFTKPLANAASKLGLNVIEAQPNLAGEDFSYYQTLIPGYFVFLGSEGPFQWHHPAYTINENCLEIGARFFAQAAEELLNSESVFC